MISTLIIIILYSLLWIFSGTSILSRFRLQKNLFHSYFYFGASFFIGGIFFLTSWVTLALLLHSAKNSLFVSSILSILYIAYYFSSSWQFLYKIFNVKIVFLTLVVVGLTLLRALVPMPAYFISNPDYVNPFEGFGAVGHSFRAGNLITYLTTNDYIPVLNQHIGQSLISSIPVFLGENSSQLSLVLWLGVFITMLIFVSYGLALSITSNKILAAIPTLVVLLGNTTLSPLYSGITDTESALLLCSNMDTIFGIMTFLIICILLFLCIKDIKNRIYFYLILAATCYIWNITSGQMFILLLPILLIGLIMYRKNLQSRKFFLICLIIVPFFTYIGASLLGGMLLPEKYNGNAFIPGMLQLQNNNYKMISLRFPRTGEGSPHTISSLQEIMTGTSTVITNQHSGSQLGIDLRKNSFLFDIARIVRSFQVIVFPLIGMIGIIYLLKDEVDLEVKRFLKIFTLATIVVFILGWTASTFFLLYGYYWELSKFFYCGVFGSMFLFGLTISFLFKKRRISVLLLSGCLIFVLLGPSLEYFGVRLIGNFYLFPHIDGQILEKIGTGNLQPLTLSERYEFLVSDHPTYGSDF